MQAGGVCAGGGNGQLLGVAGVCATEGGGATSLMCRTPVPVGSVPASEAGARISEMRARFVTPA